MTYCLGILLPEGLVLASDSRSSAGFDSIAVVCKLATIAIPGDRLVVIQSAGNLATTQAVVRELKQALGSGNPKWDVALAPTMSAVAGIVGAKMRDVVLMNEKFVKPYGDPTASFLVGGQITGEPPRLLKVYSAGNFVEASPRTCFLQIGEAKYGKPILDRALEPSSTLAEAEKLALLSFDATIRSNLSVGAPIDILRYRTDSLTADPVITPEDTDPYWLELRLRYAEGLNALVTSLPEPNYHGA